MLVDNCQTSPLQCTYVCVYVYCVCTCMYVQWNLSKMGTVVGSHFSKTAIIPGSNGTKALQSTSVEQPPLYKGQLELAHKWHDYIP